MNKKFLNEYMKRATETLRKQPKISQEEALKQIREQMLRKPEKSSKPAK